MNTSFLSHNPILTFVQILDLDIQILMNKTLTDQIVQDLLQLNGSNSSLISSSDLAQPNHRLILQSYKSPLISSNIYTTHSRTSIALPQAPTRSTNVNPLRTMMLITWVLERQYANEIFLSSTSFNANYYLPNSFMPSFCSGSNFQPSLI